MTRPLTHRYEDPLDALWLETAARMGLRIERGPESYATTDGQGTLRLSDQAGMDPDDCLAQMIFHEICHSLIQGNPSFGWVDWGLDNETNRDDCLEHACLRLQAALLAPYGLRRTLAPTTDFRSFYELLPDDPFEERTPEERESIVRARAAYARRNRPPWREHLEKALEQTSAVLHATKAVIEDRSGSLLTTVEPERPKNEAGLFVHADPTRTCDDCAWAYVPRKSSPMRRCRQADGAPIAIGQRACERHEKPFDCLQCGACCREAYDTVEVSQRDPAKKRHLDLMVERQGGHDMRREGPRCICLLGGVSLTPPLPSILGGSTPPEEGHKTPPLMMPGGAPFTCSIYEDRPKTCRDFTIFSEHCLTARRTVGLSR